MNILHPPGLLPPVSAYSHGVSAHGFVFVAGQVGMDGTGKLAEGIAAQTTQAIHNVQAVLAEAGGDLSHVVQTTVYLRSFDDYWAFDAAYAEAFGGHRPPRATVRADLLAPQLLVEVQAIAFVGGR